MSKASAQSAAYGVCQEHEYPEPDAGHTPPMVGKKTRDAKGPQQGFELQKHLVSATTENVGQDLTGPMIDGMPQPTGLALLAHKAPHFIDLGVRDPADAHFDFT